MVNNFSSTDKIIEELTQLGCINIKDLYAKGIKYLKNNHTIIWIRKCRPIGDFQANHIKNNQKSKQSHQKHEDDPKADIDQKWSCMLIGSFDPINLRLEISDDITY